MKVLVLGRHAGMMSSALKMLADAGHEAIGVLDDDEAERELRTGGFDAIAIGGGVENGSRVALRAVAKETNTAFVEVFGPQMLIGELSKLAND